jgi:protocatechuate 3,4-dioxygenase beta subunit
MNRREALAGFGAVSLGSLLAACSGDDEGAAVGTSEKAETAATTAKTKADPDLAKLFEDAPSCSVTPEQTEGPYYFDADKVRSDIREDREGVRLRLALRVRDAGSCKPLPDAVVDIWHADAGGAYSGFDDAAAKTRYLRGAQVTNSDGVVEFTTIYPGWYQGRTVHVHVKVHLNNADVLTSQLYFDDDVSNAVFGRAEYAARGERDQRNESDGIYDPSLVMTTKRDGDGYLGVMSFDVRAA